jgi:hypothetical protein
MGLKQVFRSKLNSKSLGLGYAYPSLFLACALLFSGCTIIKGSLTLFNPRATEYVYGNPSNSAVPLISAKASPNQGLSIDQLKLIG